MEQMEGYDSVGTVRKLVAVTLNRPNCKTRLGISLENVQAGRFPLVKRVAPDGIAADLLQPGDVLTAFGGITTDIGTPAVTELLKEATGALQLVVERRVLMTSENAITVDEHQPTDEVPPAAALAFSAHPPLPNPVDKSGPASLLDADERLALRIEDTLRLASALKLAVAGHADNKARSISIVTERSQVEKREAVESAALAASRATEARCREEFEAKLKMALEEAVKTSKIEQEEAVLNAIRQTEERCSEAQRVAVAAVTASLQRAMGQSEDTVAESAAATAFQEAAASAGAALAAALQVQNKFNEAYDELPFSDTKVTEPVSEGVAGTNAAGDNLYFF
uniref:PDZ domain-containing protein n=1 Tax=Coccolithus braarudii TaxID=221442 RepID=A0A7S0L408_9EUKA|mmetsp:Transcript_18646/g.40197  ORF Transcript_18646/g.40197 Transcript_18646/m.40197 type:complete len:339 (+) Transcript_18646:123-1139(+)|eukprot:CAMPEP_0183378854 /NCGR_PEP_ID=MMETSP0164_2-20130417/125128_1 /TAXON_ID=221442 /ORGANISM="Coccolithus pelagicus ssp braarudi, Strain PLY182g" /LENGTH=338 /DNA_ID=CAMNT_0025556427 /DNA_START=122 /DNA_END=1138 /DNA_ORIENTATION=+